jgi:hypothetical protein
MLSYAPKTFYLFTYLYFNYDDQIQGLTHIRQALHTELNPHLPGPYFLVPIPRKIYQRTKAADGFSSTSFNLN